VSDRVINRLDQDGVATGPVRFNQMQCAGSAIQCMIARSENVH
jgi:hypothetical protein